MGLGEEISRRVFRFGKRAVAMHEETALRAEIEVLEQDIRELEGVAGAAMYAVWERGGTSMEPLNGQFEEIRKKRKEVERKQDLIDQIRKSAVCRAGAAPEKQARAAGAKARAGEKKPDAVLERPGAGEAADTEMQAGAGEMAFAAEQAAAGEKVSTPEQAAAEKAAAAFEQIAAEGTVTVSEQTDAGYTVIVPEGTDVKRPEQPSGESIVIEEDIPPDIPSAQDDTYEFSPDDCPLICPNCGTACSAEARFCRNCGAELH